MARRPVIRTAFRFASSKAPQPVRDALGITTSTAAIGGAGYGLYRGGKFVGDLGKNTVEEFTSDEIPDAPDDYESSADALVNAMLAGGQPTQVATFYQQQHDLLFPKDATSGGVLPYEGLEGGLSRFISTRADPDVFTDPTTGAIKLENDVIVDPSRDPFSGVLFPPNSDVEGSYVWLNNAAKEWEAPQINKWRKRLRRLGYDIAPEGDFDQTLRASLDLYFRNKYFFGQVIPLDQTPDGEEAIAQAFDPVEIRSSIRTAYRETMGVDPEDDEMKRWEKVVHKEVKKALAKGATPGSARLQATEKFADRFEAQPIAQPFLRQAERAEAVDRLENTKLRDSILSVAQLVNGL